MSRMRRLFALSIVLLAFPSALTSQDVTYRSRIQIRFGGALQGLASAAARMSGTSLEWEETQYIKGRRTRTDLEESSSIVDMELRRALTLDHPAKTYTEFSFDSLKAMV